MTIIYIASNSPANFLSGSSGYSLLVEYILIMLEALGSIPGTVKKKLMCKTYGNHKTSLRETKCQKKQTGGMLCP